jgi:hypothetical protein
MKKGPSLVSAPILPNLGSDFLTKGNHPPNRANAIPYVKSDFAGDSVEQLAGAYHADGAANVLRKMPLLPVMIYSAAAA